jgi:hypothetical protein
MSPAQQASAPTDVAARAVGSGGVFRGLAPPVMRRVKAVVTWNYEINGNILRSKARQPLNPPIQKRLRTAQARMAATKTTWTPTAKATAKGHSNC